MTVVHHPPPPSTLDLGGFPGLTEAEAQARLERDGANELPSREQRGVWAIAWGVVHEPMFLMLVAAGALYLVMGEPKDALMLLGFVFAVMGITIVQERRTEHALEALRDLSSPRALVIREGRHRRIPGREVVPGDLLVVVEGDRIAADAVLRAGLNLSVDESLLTGESVPVRKAASTEARILDAPGGDDLPSLFSGTLVTAGQGLAEVLGTGLRTELGKIGKALQRVEPEATFLEKETGRLVRLLAFVGLSACAVVVVLYAFTRGAGAQAWKEGLLAGIALAMAILPEEFPVVLTVFMALGAWRISRSRVLTRRMPAIETLGAATVLCVDKTGTLTLNQMTLRQLDVEGHSLDLATVGPALPDSVHTLMEFAILASKRDPFDPMEQALHEAGKTWLMETEHLHPDWTLAREYPLAAGLLAVTHAWHCGEGRIRVATKGGPEAVMDLCHLSAERRAQIEGWVAGLASRGLRVLGVARGSCDSAELPEAHHDLSLDFIGLLGLEDPVRPTVPAAVAECRTAGIRVMMITGDYPATAESIARQAGIADPGKVITGPELNQMSDATLAERIREVNVFARVVPEQKLRLVTALKANREVVAMTGDGVNDAPALKAAHIGVAMGGRGTDVAREAASLVLLDDDFSTIVAAVRLGRRIFDNIRKAVAFIFAVHIPIAGLSMLPAFFPGWPLILLPVHIVFLELVIDPSCSLVFEAEEAEADVMRRPPRDPQERLFSLKSIGLAVLQGGTALAACLAVFLITRSSHGEASARALTFTTLVVSFLAIILANRSWKVSILGGLGNPNPALWWVLGSTTAFLVLVLAWPPARRLFHFERLEGPDLLLACSAGVASILWFEGLKVLRRRPRQRIHI
ncbi:MAG: cation-translocating P-type ATPase [Geothrix sp.]|nr:cation-translocating P-type ATPase [Geothrix sp.]